MTSPNLINKMDQRLVPNNELNHYRHLNPDVSFLQGGMRVAGGGGGVQNEMKV